MTAPVAVYRGEPTLADTLKTGWQARWFLVLGGLFGVLAGLLFLTLAVPHYRGLMIVAPTTRAGTPDLGGPAAAHASLATEYMLKGFNAGDAADFVLFEAVAREASVGARLMRDPSIRAGVARDKYFRLSNGRMPETAEDMARYLQKRVEIEPVGGTALRRVVYNHPDRAFARDFLRALYQATDDMIRDDVRAKANKRIEWLKHTLSTTSNADYRRSLTSLLMEQAQIRTVLAIDEPYAARLAEKPSVVIRPSWPRKALVLPVFLVCGMILGAAVFGVRRALSVP